MVFAAASTFDVLSAIEHDFEQDHPEVDVRISFASTSTLVRQIEQGADAAVIVSAHADWMDALETARRLRHGTRRIVATNRLVLVGPSDTPPVTDAADAFADREHRIAVGDPAHVPVGMYARAALDHAGLWSSIEARIIPTLDARFAVRLVQRGEAMRGILYRSDATNNAGVSVLFAIPTEWHERIAYEAALIGDGDRAETGATPANADLDAFMRFLEDSQRWNEAGFSPPPNNDP